MTTREFTAVGHCGGKLSVKVVTEDGHRKYQLGYSHSSATPAGFGILLASLEGHPLSFVQAGGLNTNPRYGPAHLPGVQVFIGSDMQGLYGHQCPKCKEYWRPTGFPAGWPMGCPYCGLR